MSLRDEAGGADLVTGDQGLAACQALCVHGLISPMHYFPKVGVMSPNLQMTLNTIVWCQGLNSGPVSSEEASLLGHGE